MRFPQFLLILVLFPASLLAQSQAGNQPDITGLWTGTLHSDSTHQFYKYEIGISKEKGKLIGFSHTCFTVGDREYFAVKRINIKKAADGKIIIADDQLVLDNYADLPAKYMRQLNVLTLNTADSIMQLSGPFVTKRTKEYQSITGSVMLRRKNEFWQSAIWPYLLELDKEKNFAFLKEYTPPVILPEPVRTMAQLNREQAPKK